MSRLIVLLCIALTAVSAVARDFQYTHKGQTLWYTVIDESSLTCKTRDGVKKNKPGNSVTGTLKIPNIASDGVNNYTVVGIGAYAFSNSQQLKSVSLPTSVSLIERYAFYSCTELKTINLINSIAPIERLAYIGDRSFAGCTNLESIAFPFSVKRISKEAFKNCRSLSTIVIPDSVTYLGKDCFAGCALKNIYVIGRTPTIKKRLLDDYTTPILHVRSVDAFKKDKGWSKFTTIVALDNPFMMSLEPEYICGKATESIKLKAPIYPKEGNYAPLIWRSSNPEMVSVDQNGTATFHVNTDSTIVCAISASPYYGGLLSTIFDVVPTVSFSVEKKPHDADDIIPVRVSMNNPKLSVASVICDVYLPSEFEPLQDSEGNVDVSLTNRKDSTHNILGKVLDDGRIRVVAYSESDNSFKGTDGEIFTLNIKSKSATKGSYPILIDKIIAFDTNQRRIYCVKVSSEIVLTPSATKGDVSSD